VYRSTYTGFVANLEQSTVDIRRLSIGGCYRNQNLRPLPMTLYYDISRLRHLRYLAVVDRRRDRRAPDLLWITFLTSLEEFEWLGDIGAQTQGALLIMCSKPCIPLRRVTFECSGEEPSGVLVRERESGNHDWIIVQTTAGSNGG